ncbi:MAG: hypothetical protein J6127_02675 [Clostridiales bacterium]|nr:hypothetical protein [Clostridiales bacterium]
MAKKERLVGIIMAVIMSAAMGIIMALIVRMTSDANALASMPPAPVMVITSVLESIVVGVIIVLIFPLGKMGRVLAAKAGATPPGIRFTLLNSIPFALINALGCSIIVCFINVAVAHSHIPADVAPPLMVMFLKQWASTLVPSIILGYVLSVIISPLVVRAVGLGGPPSGRPE